MCDLITATNAKSQYGYTCDNNGNPSFPSTNICDGSWSRFCDIECMNSTNGDEIIDFPIKNLFDLQGTIPVSIGSLTALTSFSIYHTGLKGIIPQTISQLTNLEEIHIQKSALTGIISPGMSALSRLKCLQLNDNRLTGSISDGFSKLSQLKQLMLDGNMLTGSIPAGFCVFTQDLDVYAHGNKITRVPACIPSNVHIEGVIIVHTASQSLSPMVAMLPLISTAPASLSIGGNTILDVCYMKTNQNLFRYINL